MKKSFLQIGLFFFSFTSLRAQQNNPLINSGIEIQEGTSLYDQGKYKEAFNKLVTVPETDTNYALSRYELALVCSADSQYHRGIGYCQEAIALHTQRNLLPQLFSLLGSFYERTDQKDSALYIFDSALVLYPAHLQLYISKGSLLFKQNKYPEAAEIFEQGLLINPFSSILHFNLGVTAIRQGNPVAAFLSLTASLMMEPKGQYASSAISLLNSIAMAKDDITRQISARAEDVSESFRSTEEILLSKIALEKAYKPIIRLDDAISRQMQVIFEKLDPDESSNNFWIKFYVPYYRQVFKQKKFELLVNHAFSSANVEEIQRYNRDNKKDMQRFVDELVAYFKLVKETRELNAGKRTAMNEKYYFTEDGLAGKGVLRNEKPVGSWEFYYPSGNIKTRGSFNDKYAKTGAWKYYYFDGKLKGEENYLDGQEEGEEIYYYDNRNVSAKSFYRNGLIEGKKITYYRGGSVSSVQQYQKGKLNGIYTAYYESGNLKSSAVYANGDYDGDFVTYFENGNIEKKGSYSKGLLNGPYQVYTSTGLLSQEGQYEKDYSSGLFTSYFPDHRIQKKEIFKNGKTDGEYIEYHNNGAVHFRYLAKNGNYDGRIDYFDTNGVKYATRTFVNDILSEGSYYDKKGLEIGSSRMQNGKLDFTAYNEDGYKLSTIPYNDKGQRNGLQQLFYRSGKLSETAEYKNNELDGKVTGYNVNGKISYSYVCKAGKKDGYYISYYQNGAREKEGWYVDDQAQGVWIYYDEQGNTVTRSGFLNDELNGPQTEYWPNGRLKFRNLYEHGDLVSIIQFDTLGNQATAMELRSGNGKYNVRYPNGKSSAEGNYRNGLLDGVFTTFYFNHTPEAIQYFKGGLRDSIYSAYNYEGKLVNQGRYVNNEKTGTWKKYDRSGQLYAEEHYDHDLLHGKTVYFYPDGQAEVEIDYVYGDRNGLYKRFSEKGELMYQLRYRDGVVVGYTYNNDKSVLVPEIAIPGKTGRVKTYYQNGTPSAEFEYVDGKLNGVHNLYHSNGKPKLLSKDVFGSSEGLVQEYFANGNRKSKYNYQYDNMHGAYSEFYESGVVKESGSFYNGYPHGTITLFSEKGKRLDSRKYYYGKLLSVSK